MTIKQTMRAKHQVLILKCYPKLPKNPAAAEIKPNGSELSYLLYYASSRRSKLSKIGTFLEKKTSHDLYKWRTSSVQITLQILNAFLNNSAIGGGGPQGFGLFAPYVLRILDEILREANEAILVETAVSVWDSFCKHQDHATLSADAEYGALYASVVSLWAGYATKEQIVSGKAAEKRGKMRVGVADNVMLRTAGLEALRSTIESDSLATETGRQLTTIMPVVLQNLYDGDGDLDHIIQLNDQSEHMEREKVTRSRPSLMSINDPPQEDRDPRAAETTVDEADRLADQEASRLALRCLKSVFTYENRAQIRAATNCVLQFIVSHQPKEIRSGKGYEDADDNNYWTVQLFKAICQWTPVQDRFVAIFTAVEKLITSPVDDDDLKRQLLLALIVSSLLASDINLIGLSVMDVLLGLLHLILKHLQAGAGEDARGSDDALADASLTTVAAGKRPAQSDTENSNVSSTRTHLLFRLQQCVSRLAVHVYYTDQISDMIVAIVLRIKPSSLSNAGHLQVPLQSSSGTPSAAGDDGSRSVSDAGANSLSSPRAASTRTASAGFVFTTPLARETALNAITQIIICANQESRNTNYVATHRNPVPLQVWESTSWLLRDPDLPVREAYIRAFKTWMAKELPKLSLDSAAEEERKFEQDFKRKSLNKDLAKRAANSASAKKAATWRIQTTVLQTIHVAVVDALQNEAQSRHSTSTVTPDILRGSATSPSMQSFTTARESYTRSPPNLYSPKSPRSPQLERGPSLPPLSPPMDNPFPSQLACDWDPSSSLGTLEAVLSSLSAQLNLPSLDEFRASQPASTSQSHSPRVPHGGPNGASSSPGGFDDDPRRPSLAQSIGRSAAIAAGTGHIDRTDFATLAPPGVPHVGELPASASVSDLKRVLETESSLAGLQSSHSATVLRNGSNTSSVHGPAGSLNAQHFAVRSHSLGNINGGEGAGTNQANGHRALNSTVPNKHSPSTKAHTGAIFNLGSPEDGSGSGTPASKAQSVRSTASKRVGGGNPNNGGLVGSNGAVHPALRAQGPTMDSGAAAVNWPLHGGSHEQEGEVRSVLAHSIADGDDGSADGDQDSLMEFGGSWVSFNADPDRVMGPPGAAHKARFLHQGHGHGHGHGNAAHGSGGGSSFRAGERARPNLDVVGLLGQIGIHGDDSAAAADQKDGGLGRDGAVARMGGDGRRGGRGAEKGLGLDIDGGEDEDFAGLGGGLGRPPA